MDERPIFITGQDLERLRALVDKQWATGRDSRYLAKLRGELEKAEVVDPKTVPGDVVTMRSQVELTDLDTGSTVTYTLVFPDEADLNQGKVSVLAPIGTAMLGYRVGDTFEWDVPAGTRRLQVTRIFYQPEAAGDWDL
jgi:regulator of nucleoside diphosphate kinase